ncbi:MAG: Uma2 family endonuclease [Gemmataceae bacterium]
MLNNPPIVYPDSDGKPIGDNTRQTECIFLIYTNLSALFAPRPNVFVACSNLWYPVEGRPDIRIDPDVYVAFGRPKGHRGSYRQWEEDDVPLTVVFEVLSPGNSPQEMRAKQLFYEEYGVEEYYVYDPDSNHLQVLVRHGDVLRRVRSMHDHVSPRLGIRFDLTGPEMVVYRPDGEPFRTFTEIRVERDAALRRADEALRMALAERQRAERLAERLRQLGIDPDA